MNGFELFCPGHILILILILSLTAAFALFIKRSSDGSFTRTVRILSAALLAGEVIQDILLINEGRDIMDILPLHLCNLGIFINLFAAFGKGKVRSFFAGISLLLIMPGAVGALIFPDWNYRPLWSYLPLMCFFTHALLILIPVLFLIKGIAKPSFRTFHHPVIFLLVITPLIYLFDLKTESNYMYLMYPASSSPLEMIHNITGDQLYIAGLLVMVILILLAEHSVYHVIFKITSSDQRY